MFKLRYVATIAIATFILVGMLFPSFTPKSRPAPTQAQDTLKIGVLTDHSGALQTYGFEQTQGFMLGLEYATGGTMEVAGRKIEVLERDNGGDIDTANSQALDLIESDGVEVLFGTVSSTVTGALQVIAEDYEIVLMAGPAASPFITGQDFNEYTFRACRNSFQDALAIADYAVNEIGPNYIQLAPDNAFGLGSAGAFDFGLQQKGGVPIQETIFISPDTADFTASLEAVRESGADFVVITWAGASGITLFQQMADLSLQDDVAVIRGFSSNVIEAIANQNDEGIIGLHVYHYSFPDNEINDWLVERHIEDYGMPPDLFSECGFATAQALVAALEATEGSTDTGDLIEALEGLSWEGPKGTYTIRPEDHQALVPMYVAQLTDVTATEDFMFYTLLETIEPEASAPPCLAPADRSSEEVPCLGE